jgi:hypothetical protein
MQLLIQIRNLCAATSRRHSRGARELREVAEPSYSRLQSCNTELEQMSRHQTRTSGRYRGVA